MILQPENQTNLIEVFSALLTPAIGIATVVILVLQYFLAKRQQRVIQLKTRHDLFEKRWAIYLKVRDLFSKIMTAAKIDYETLLSFLRETAEREFLFDKDIPSYIDEIYKKGCDLAYCSGMLEGDNLPVGEERTKVAEKKSEVLKWFMEQPKVTVEKFRKYLDVSELH